MDGALRTSLNPTPDRGINSSALFAWVYAGLLRYQLGDPVESSSQIEQLQRPIAMALSGYAGMEWREIDTLLGEMLPLHNPAFGRLLAEPGCDPQQIFLFALCSAIELEPPITALLAQIQGDSDADWLQVGTAVSVLQFLFNQSTVADIADGPLVAKGLLRLEGQGPMVQRQLVASGYLWQSLCDARLPPAVSALDAGRDEIFAADLLARAGLLIGSGNSVAVTCDRHTGRALTVQLAAFVQRRAVVTRLAEWRRPGLRRVADAVGWLPLVDCLDADVEQVHDIRDGVAVLLLRTEQAMPDGCIRLPLPVSDSGRRRHWWRAWIEDEAALSTLASAPLSHALVERIGRQLSGVGDDSALRRVRMARTADVSAELRRVALPVETHIDDRMMILPQLTLTELERAYRRCLQRDYRQLGMGSSIRATARQGVVLLFSGGSGSGKTLASSWLASRLGAPLFKIDLAMVMNKYVGETEKNLSLALTEAAACDAILLFDEADALFGRRNDGSHGGDRFANLLTNFLLSRIETHSGIVVLTTNADNRMDPAFQRRVDVAVEFLSLGFDDRLRLWRNLLAGRAPDDEVLKRFARHCELAPGHVRNIVVNASCWYPLLTPLTVAALWQALEQEYRKVGRSMPAQLMAMQPTVEGDPAGA